MAKDKLKTKPVVELKTGIWVNREKLRNTIVNMSMFYGMINVIMVIYGFINRRITESIIFIVISIPLGIILLSYNSYLRKLKKEEKESENGQKQDIRKPEQSKED